MRMSDVKKHLATMENVSFKLPDGEYVPAHFHLTEIGLVTKHFIDCGGVERKESIASFQLWVAGDYDHRLKAQKFLKIIDMSGKILGDEDLEIEVEYQQGTVGKFGLDFDGKDFVLTNRQTACLAMDACGIPAKVASVAKSCCAPASGCC
jgi:Family of unknown function (DUF6428)